MHKIFWLLILIFISSSVALAQPPNDDCVNAITLTPSPNSTCNNTAGTTVGVVSTNYDNCAEFEKRNVWYKFTATAATHIVQVTFGSIQNVSINGFANGCGTLTALNCGGLGESGPVIQQIYNSLTVGQEYLITVSTRQDTEEGTFDICITTPQAPANDECVNNTLLTVNPSNVPAIRTNSTTIFATQSLPGCSGTADDDVWFRFTATQSAHRIFIFNSGNSLTVETFSGSCGALTSISCVTPSAVINSIPLTGLTPGQTYFTRVYSFDGTFSSQQNFQIAITSAPINDECAGAITVTPSANGNNSCTSTIAGSTFDATQSSLDCFGGSSTENDTWFMFNATQAVHTIKVQGFGSNTVRMQIFSGTCGSLTSIFCSTPQFINDTAMAKVGSLVTGQSYFVRVYSGNSGGVQGLFNFCVTSPPFPANDDCINAINLVPASDTTSNFINGTTSGATNSTVPVSTCGGNSSRDVWYKFTATAPQHFIKAINLTNNSTLVTELFSGTCGSPIQLRCTQASSDSLFGLGNLNIGQQYLIRIYNYSQVLGDDFKIAVITPQSLTNDECSSAIVIVPATDATCTEISGSNAGATQSINDNCNGNALQGNIRDVWYSFTASAASHRIRLIRGTGENMRFQLYSGNCGSLTVISCSVQNTSFNIGDGIEQRFDGLVIGTNYLIRIFNTGFSEAPGTFDLCVKTVVPPPNDECSAAITLTPQNGITYGTFTRGYTVDGTTSAQPTLCSTGQDDDVWYQFTATQSNMKVFLQNAGIGTTRMAVYSGTCGSLTLVKCQTGNNRDNVVSLTGLTINTVYLVRVYSSAAGSGQGSFLIMATTDVSVPANDDCVNAILLTASANNNCSATQGTTIDANPSGNANCVSGNDVWFRFIASATSHRVNVEGLVNTPVVTVFSGSCAALTQLPSACAIGNSQISVTVNSLTIGTTYFIKVLANTPANFQQSIFNICVTTPQVPINDLCSNAILLPVDNDANAIPTQLFTTNLATFTGVPNCFGAGRDVWFSFVAPQGPVAIEVNALNTNPGIELMSGDCSSLTSVQCNGTTSFSLNNILNASDLIAGDTYKIRVSAATFAASDNLEFKIKVYKIIPAKLNISIDSTCLMNNLVQNPGFDTAFFFPTSFVGSVNPGTEVIYKWRIPTRGTADFFNGQNSTGSAVDVPAGLCFGSQSARSGIGYAGMFAYSSGGSREYIENELNTPMIPGRRYLVSMYISLAEFSTVAMDNLGIALRTTPTAQLTFSNLSFTPQVVSPDNIFMSNKKDWVNVSAVIVPDQAYRYLVIGNFKSNALTDTIHVSDTSAALAGGTFSGCATSSHVAYYYIDDVVVSEVNGSVPGCGVLPLKLLTFTGQRKDTKVVLTWKTENEINTSHFEIERSNSGTGFTKMATMASANTIGIHNYTTEDIQPYQGNNFYRLKQIDIDGRSTYSQVVKIKFEDQENLLSIYPNPAKDFIQIQVKDLQQQATVQVYDVVGRMVLQQSTPGYAPVRINIEKLPSGKYMVQLSDGETVQSGSFIKQ